MSLLVWNCQGLENPRAIRILKKLSKEKCPKLVFLVETKCSKVRMDEVRRTLKFDACFDVERVGLSGGIALLWKKVKVINYTRWHISALVTEHNSNSPWLFSGFYGHPDKTKRKGSWELLTRIKPDPMTLWLCAGDFNKILHQREKVGGPSRPYRQIEKFRLAGEACGIRDIPSLGQRYTWSNNRR
ncbi:hypothetical protein I3760_08G097900 [Carya illinoinensis]|nr:hypothetical protein I3760_08G097900 [Carya illinoinensis]